MENKNLIDFKNHWNKIIDSLKDNPLSDNECNSISAQFGLEKSSFLMYQPIHTITPEDLAQIERIETSLVSALALSLSDFKLKRKEIYSKFIPKEISLFKYPPQ